MKTITFYSYKGGVGRSLALSNIAIRLSEYNKKVCVLDFDLEAPGLHFKFKNYSNPKKIEKGIVDYIYGFSCEGNISKDIKNFSIILNPKNKKFNPINLIPAGDIDNPQYWKKLSMIKWSEMFYSEDGQGIKFFLDLKNKIKKEFNPDFLLIDSRTGITDIAGITLKVMADEVAVLAANNEENIYGSKKIIKSLANKSNSLFENIPKTNFILTRIPYSDSAKDKEKEYLIIEKLKNDFKKLLEVKEFDISVIHSDRRLEEDERTLIGYEYEEKDVSISNDYLKIFDKLTLDVLTPYEVAGFKNKREAEKEFSKSKLDIDLSKKISHLEKAVELDPSKPEYFYERGHYYSQTGDYEKAICDFNKILELNPDHFGAYNYLGYIYQKNVKDYNLSLKYYNKAIEIDPSIISPYTGKYFTLRKQGNGEDALQVLNHILEYIDPNSDQTLNSRADYYRLTGEYQKAKVDIYKAIEINSNDPVYFGTLAEIYASENKEEEFYLNLTIALSKGIKAEQLNTAKDVYEKYKKHERFINLLNKYQIDLEEIFQ